MLGKEIKSKFVSRDYDIFAGLDVDKKHIDVTFTRKALGKGNDTHKGDSRQDHPRSA